MAEFKQLIITQKGQALMAKMIAGTGNVQFTKINVSDATYTDAQLPTLTTLTGVKQTTSISRVIRTNSVAIQVEGAVTNTALTTGYYMRTIGLYALDPQEGEILYAVTIASVAGYMPPYNGLTVSGAFFKLVTTVSNSNNVTLNVDPGAVATIGDIQELNNKIADLQAYVGYTETDIVGIEADFAARTVKRIAGAVNRTAGAMFNDIQAFGGRRRCIVNNAGKVLAYYGEAGYTETGALLQAITIGTTTYPVGEKVQVMVEQPKFYYKVVPLKLDKVVGGKGFHLRKARYYVSDTKRDGFKLHPAFISNNVKKNFIYMSAFEASLFDVSAGINLGNDEQIADFTPTTGDMLSSVANVRPMSGQVQDLTRAKTRILAQNRGTGWQQAYGATVAATQLLFAVEYASFNSQSAIGFGVSKTDDGVNNMAELTGGTSTLGNASGAITNANGFNVVSYRGEENFWMNIWSWVDGLNIYAYGEHSLYVADNGFADNISAAPYKDAGITIAKANGYISAFGYNEEFDWLFFPSETTGNSSVPVGDYLNQNNTASSWSVALLGGSRGTSSNGGAFFWDVVHSSAARYRAFGGRLVYVPSEVA